MTNPPNNSFSPDAPLRRSPAALVNELRIPAEAIARALHRLGLSQLSPAGMPAPPAALLIKRARTLATELQEVIEELITLAGPVPTGPVARLRQDRLPVRMLINEAAEILDLDDRVQFEGRSDLSVNTHVPRLQEILMNLFGFARQRAATGMLQVNTTTIGLAASIEVSWRDPSPERAGLEDPDSGVPHLRVLVASLGGRLEPVSEEGRLGLRVLLPQQRAQDRSDAELEG
ncbi:MAG: hypothetical protein ACOYN3_04830 [Acidimicrobiia bacterium]